MRVSRYRIHQFVSCILSVSRTVCYLTISVVIIEWTFTSESVQIINVSELRSTACQTVQKIMICSRSCAIAVWFSLTYRKHNDLIFFFVYRLIVKWSIKAIYLVFVCICLVLLPSILLYNDDSLLYSEIVWSSQLIQMATASPGRYFLFSN